MAIKYYVVIENADLVIGTKVNKVFESVGDATEYADGLPESKSHEIHDVDFVPFDMGELMGFMPEKI